MRRFRDREHEVNTSENGCEEIMRTADGFLRSPGAETRFLAGRGGKNGDCFTASSLNSGHDHQFLTPCCQRTMSVKRWYGEKFFKTVCNPSKINRIP